MMVWTGVLCHGMRSALPSTGSSQISRVLNFLFNALGLLQVQHDTCSVQQWHFSANVLDMFICSLWKHDDVFPIKLKARRSWMVKWSPWLVESVKVHYRNRISCWKIWIIPFCFNQGLLSQVRRHKKRQKYGKVIRVHVNRYGSPIWVWAGVQFCGKPPISTIYKNPSGPSFFGPKSIEKAHFFVTLNYILSQQSLNFISIQ